MKSGKEEVNEKTCNKCLITLPATTNYFYKHKGGRLGIKAICKSCCDVKSRAYEVRLRKDRPDHSAYLSYLRNVYIKYRLREQDVRDMMDEQGGCCAACGDSLVKPVYSKSNLHIDHDHTSGKVRGLLCGSCNTLLGHMENNLRRVNLLEEYLLWYNRLGYGVINRSREVEE